MVRPAITFLYRGSSLAFISLGSIQLTIMQSSALLEVQMTVRSSTRATSFFAVWCSTQPGSSSWFSSVSSPVANACSRRARSWPSEPSIQMVLSGVMSSSISLTQSRTCWLLVNAIIKSPFFNVIPSVLKRAPMARASFRIAGPAPAFQ